VKCPECFRLATKSTVRLDNNAAYTSTDWPADVYWDEEGRKHIHDQERMGGSFKCSQGHSFAVFRRPACPSCDWAGHGFPDVYVTRNGKREQLESLEVKAFLDDPGSEELLPK
jgi:hypothetical protein